MAKIQRKAAELSLIINKRGNLGKLEMTPTSHLPPSLCYPQAQGESKAMTANLCEIRQLSLAVPPDPSPTPHTLEILAPEGRGSTKHKPHHLTPWTYVSYWFIVCCQVTLHTWHPVLDLEVRSCTKSLLLYNIHCMDASFWSQKMNSATLHGPLSCYQKPSYT